MQSVLLSPLGKMGGVCCGESTGTVHDIKEPLLGPDARNAVFSGPRVHKTSIQNERSMSARFALLFALFNLSHTFLSLESLSSIV